jgi:hypothetical protein
MRGIAYPSSHEVAAANEVEEKSVNIPITFVKIVLKNKLNAFGDRVD